MAVDCGRYMYKVGFYDKRGQNTYVILLALVIIPEHLENLRSGPECNDGLEGVGQTS